MNVRINHRKALLAAILDPFATPETIGAALDKSVVFPSAIDRFDAALASLFAEPGDGVPLARLLLESAEDTGAVIVFADALFDQRLAYRGFRYLAAALMVFGRRVADAGGAGVANPGVTDAGGVGAGDAGGAGARLGGEGEAEGPGSAS